MAAHQAPPSLGFSRQEHWSGLPFPSPMHEKVKVKSLSRVQLLVTSWTAAYQAPPSMGFSRQEYWSGVPLPSLTRPSRTNTKKDVLFIIRDWNAKEGSQEIPGVSGKFGLGVQNEVGQRLKQFCEENALVIANNLFQQHKRWLYTWTSSDGQYWIQIDFYSLQQ